MMIRTTTYGGKYFEILISQQTKMSNGVSIVYWAINSLGPSNLTVGPLELWIGNDRVCYCEEPVSGNHFPACYAASGESYQQHKPDGTLTLDIRFMAVVDTGTSSGNITFNTTMELDPVIGEPTITTAPNFTDEDNPTVTYTNYSGDNATSLDLQITSADGSQIFATRSVPKSGGSYTFVLTDDEREALRIAGANTSSLSVKFKIVSVINGETYSRETSKYCRIINCHPKILATIEDINPETVALTGDNQKLIKYYSNVMYTTNVTTYKYATVSWIKAVNGSNTITASSGVFNAVTSNTFKFSVKDSRGNMQSATKDCSVIPYVKLTCNFNYTNPTAAGDMTFTVSGNYYNGSFGATDNTLTVEYRYKGDKEDKEFSEWRVLTPTISQDNTYSVECILTGLDYQTGYTFEARASDKLNPAIYSESTFVKSSPLFHWSKDEVVFEVPVIFNAGTTGADGTGSGSGTGSGGVSGVDNGVYTGDLRITGDLRLKGNGNYGNSLLFGDSSYCYLKEVSDDSLTIHSKNLITETSQATTIDAQTLNLNGDTININGNPLPYVVTSGTWIPKLNSSIVSSYSNQQGWYIRMGAVVILGFFINATCKSGYSGTNISISNLPYAPAHSGYGGGFATGVYASAGYIFQGWAVNTSGDITARMQPCNNTAAGTLTTSSVACKYPASAGAVNLGGTITYVTTQAV